MGNRNYRRVQGKIGKMLSIRKPGKMWDTYKKNQFKRENPTEWLAQEEAREQAEILAKQEGRVILIRKKPKTTEEDAIRELNSLADTYWEGRTYQYPVF